MAEENSLVYGIGINDADYVVRNCPYYSRWKHMIKRCYSEKFISDTPSYIGCHVIPEWHYFMTFRAWMEKQDWKDKHLDKDLLVKGNRLYGPDTCVFIDQAVNKFILENDKNRGACPIGVDFVKRSGKYRALCKDVKTGKVKYLGTFKDSELAHQAWLTFKLEQAKILASQQLDPRVSKAIIERYENYVS